LTKRDKLLARASEKLVWILTLLIIGLDHEMKSSAESSTSTISHQSAQADAAKSISKILLDYVSRHVRTVTEQDRTIERCKLGGGTSKLLSSQDQVQHGVPKTSSLRQSYVAQTMSKAKRKQQQQMQQQQQQMAELRIVDSSSSPNNNALSSPLLQIGDVLHRTRSFLADSQSPPTEVLRSEMIGLLCDILDMDVDMELSDLEDTLSAGGAIKDDLGSAGSLLKLIVRNCATMDSGGVSGDEGGSSITTKGIGGGYAGNRFLAVVHRLAASRSTSARITACSLGPVLWGHLDFPHQLQLRGVITRALHDVEVIVRKATAGVLHEIAELVFDPRSVPWLVLMCERAMTDPEPQLRAAAMTLTWHLAEHLPNAFFGDASKGSRSLSRLPSRADPSFAEVYLLQCKLLPVATRLAEDRAAPVRLAVAAQCDRLCAVLGEHWSSVIIDLLQALLGDADERVRSEAVLCFPRLVESVLVGSNETANESVLESLLPVAIKLLKDPASGVRVALATASGELLTLLVGLGSYDDLVSAEKVTSGANGENAGQDAGFKRHKRHVDDTLIPLVQRLLHDTDPEVTSAALRAVTNASRGNVKEISGLKPECGEQKTQQHQHHEETSCSASTNVASSPIKEPVFIPVLSETQVLRLLPTLSHLATSPQWRVRQSAVEIVPALLGCTQQLETRTEIAQLCVKLMKDSVDAVRKTAAECLCLGGGSLGGDGGGEWIRAIVIPNLKTCRDSPKSKERMLCLKMVEVIVSNRVCSGSHSRKLFPVSTNEVSTTTTPSPLREILEVASSLSADKVANVRLNVGRVFKDIMETLVDVCDIEFVTSVLEEQLTTETSRQSGDRDVIYFAKGALTRARDRLSEHSSLSSVSYSMTSSRQQNLISSEERSQGGFEC